VIRKVNSRNCQLASNDQSQTKFTKTRFMESPFSTFLSRIPHFKDDKGELYELQVDGPLRLFCLTQVVSTHLAGVADIHVSRLKESQLRSEELCVVSCHAAWLRSRSAMASPVLSAALWTLMAHLSLQCGGCLIENGDDTDAYSLAALSDQCSPTPTS
jgi:hypothetical protein